MTKKNELKTTTISKTNTTQTTSFTLENIIDALREKYDLKDCYPEDKIGSVIGWTCTEDVRRFANIDLHDDVLTLTIDKTTTTKN